MTLVSGDPTVADGRAGLAKAGLADTGLAEAGAETGQSCRVSKTSVAWGAPSAGPDFG